MRNLQRERGSDLEHAQTELGVEGGHRVHRLEDLTERLLQEIYGIGGEPGIRAEIMMLKTGIDKLNVNVESIGKKQTPRGVLLLFMIIFAISAVVTAGVTLVSAIRVG